MKIKNNVGIFNATNSLKVLSCLSDYPEKEFSGSELQKSTGLSRAGVYLSLNELKKQGFVTVVKRGKFLFYSLAYDEPVIKQFKVLKNVLFLNSLITNLKPFVRKIVLFGSYSRGENDSKSDIDLFVIAQDPQSVKDVVSSYKTRQKIQAVVITAAELPGFKEKEETFMHEVGLGIILWEKKE
jgi:predicted nucleotidyltransferase/biotin operon repressor